MGSLAGISPNPGMPIVSPENTIPYRKLKSAKSHVAMSGWGYPDGPGWSNRHVKRMATKRRNKARHKSSGKGR
jgi:hypothetical protein